MMDVVMDIRIPLRTGGWWGTACTHEDNRDEKFLQTTEDLKQFIEEHADDPEVVLIHFRRM